MQQTKIQNKYYLTNNKFIYYILITLIDRTNHIYESIKLLNWLIDTLKMNAQFQESIFMSFIASCLWLSHHCSCIIHYHRQFNFQTSKITFLSHQHSFFSHSFIDSPIHFPFFQLLLKWNDDFVYSLFGTRHIWKTSVAKHHNNKWIMLL